MRGACTGIKMYYKKTVIKSLFLLQETKDSFLEQNRQPWSLLEYVRILCDKRRIISTGKGFIPPLPE